MTQELTKEYQKLLFGIRISIRYHIRRRMFFDTLYQVTRALTVLFGAATFMLVVSENLGTQYAKIIPLVVTVASAVSLVIEPARKARLHDDLARRFTTLEREMVDHYTEGDHNKFMAERLTIEADEPPPMNMVHVLAHNEVSRWMGYKPGELYHLKWYHRWLAHFINFRVDLIITNKEWEEKAIERSRQHLLAKDRANDEVGTQ